MSSAGMLTIPLQDAIDSTLEEQEQWSRTYVGASMIAQECERAVWYDWLWASPKQFPGRILRRFQTGHTMEERVIARLREAGFEVHCENPKARNPKKQYAAEHFGGFFRGHVDGFIRGASDNQLVELGNEWHLLEVKAMASAKYHYADDDDSYDTPLANRDPSNPDHLTAAGNAPNIEGRWWKCKRRGVKKEHQTYYGQMQSYMGISHEQHSSGQPFWQYWQLDAPLKHSLFVAVNTDTEQIHAELIEFEPKWWVAAKRRAERVMRARESGPERIRETPMYPPCSFCDHREVCHRGEPMAVNCRTCKHAEVRLPGDRGYFGDRATWLCTVHGHNCGDFTACDSYDPLIDPLEF